MMRHEDEAKPFLDHLDELRSALLKSLGALLLGVLVAWPLAPTILDLLKRPLINLVEDPDRYLQSLQVAGAFTSALRIIFWSGFLLALPVILFVIGQFIFPGLTLQEKKWVRLGAGSSFLLFAFGVLLGYSITLEVALKVMHEIHRWLGVEPMWTLTSYVTFCMHLLIGFGLSFQLPMVVLILGRMGILSVSQLREKRRHVFVGLLLMAMFLTPPDPFTQLIMAVPLYLLYECCIILLAGFGKRS
jgi:sec-independent protein translocase protein TatC